MVETIKRLTQLGNPKDSEEEKELNISAKCLIAILSRTKEVG